MKYPILFSVLASLVLLCSIYVDSYFHLGYVPILVSYILIVIIALKRTSNQSKKSNQIFSKDANLFIVILATFTFSLITTSIDVVINGELTLEQNSLLPYTVFMAVLVFPIFEELVFRRYILGELLKTKNFYFSLFFSAFLFAITHIFADIGLFYPFIAGIFLGLIYLRTRNVILCIIAHSIYNLIEILISQNYLDFILQSLNFNLSIIIFVVSLILCILLIKKMKII